MIVMLRRLSRSSFVVLWSALALLACTQPKPEQPADQARASEQASADARRGAKLDAGDQAMPETFAAFARPNLAALDGVWIIDQQQPNRAIVWQVEDHGSVLTTIDRHGDEQLHGVTLSSPCALRLTDETGRAHSRSIALSSERLIVTSKGAVAVAAADGSLLACAGQRTFQIAADGRCRFTTELLGTWSDHVEAEDTCRVETVEGVRSLIVAGQRLREHADGLWLDEVAAADVAVRMPDRAAAIAAITPPPTAAAAAAAASSETGETGEQSDQQ